MLEYWVCVASHCIQIAAHDYERLDQQTLIQTLKL